MARKCFYSFHYKPDAWRASKVRNIGAIEGNQTVTDNKWEEIIKGGDVAIQKWIDGELSGKSCAIVLIGANTAGRKWIKYEIEKAWSDGKGLVGIYIHNITDGNNKRSVKGSSPFSGYNVNGKALTSITKAYDPPYLVSADVYNYISENIEGWVEAAITVRKNV